MQADGRIVVAGFATARRPMPTSQADRRIVVVGQASSLGANPDIAIARFLPDGTADAAFGTAGKVTLDFFGAIDGAGGVVLQPDGRIVVGGFARNAGATGFAAARLLP